MVRYQIILDPVEADILAIWAASEMRDPRDQIRFVLRQALERRGLLTPTDESSNQKRMDDLNGGGNVAGALDAK